ncbi:hypothetical protein SASPL_128330 [Salvia splendens]|uniref:Glabrous enhancer-binding protein-like DBD domain-containing protein n=1 Tax=Salvia splendens TaxID=180675 RepID=A0A8X8ZMM6_SALSN|nr:probable transcription factor At1g61730 [Salvia splendens]KAG6410276.1 hypothetical protein SASPL_128330 [Salvia splendens]
MAKSREPVKPVEESDSSDEGSSSEEESDADLDPTPPQNKPQPQIPAAKPSQPLPPPSSSDEDDSGSDTESESDAPEVRPLAAKPVEETPKSNRKAKSNPTADPVTPGKSAAASKRPAEDTASKDAKKPKKSPAAEPETAEKKSNMFQRLWSEEDEIVILEGMIEFQNKFKVDPLANLDQYHDFIKKSLQTDFTDFTRTQLQDKIRRLKRKYVKSREKDGKDKVFSKPQEQMAYDLSKAIWGNEDKGVVKVMGSPRANGSVVRRAVGKKDADDVKSKEVEKKMTSLNRCGATMEERLCIYGEAAFGSGDVENEWNKLKVEELKVYLKQLEVKVAQTKLVLAAMEGKDQ